MRKQTSSKLNGDEDDEYGLYSAYDLARKLGGQIEYCIEADQITFFYRSGEFILRGNQRYYGKAENEFSATYLWKRSFRRESM